MCAVLFCALWHRQRILSLYSDPGADRGQGRIHVRCGVPGGILFPGFSFFFPVGSDYRLFALPERRSCALQVASAALSVPALAGLCLLPDLQSVHGNPFSRG